MKNHEFLCDFFFSLDRFDIHANKIIRTDESINMGAKFIADVELMSHDQCLRLCCETEGCNVFVYEEKVKFLSVKIAPVLNFFLI